MATLCTVLVISLAFNAYMFFLNRSDYSFYKSDIESLKSQRDKFRQLSVLLFRDKYSDKDLDNYLNQCGFSSLDYISFTFDAAWPRLPVPPKPELEKDIK